ncbi:AAA family ATPase [Bacteroides sp.]|uniref:AAA family ATPase n=1 Tax=Bacteroides sp. TaxID=29523 RepID=UPI0026061A17|nr:AAA family ATPase [Bacteroides sp.]MDD3038796.1 AAA family ATPase [Bacteroides sp.]
MTKKKNTTIDENTNDLDEQIKAFLVDMGAYNLSSDNSNSSDTSNVTEPESESKSDYDYRLYRTTRYVDKGVTYFIPVDTESEGKYKLEDLIVNADEESFHHERIQNRLYFKPDTKRTIRIAVCASKVRGNDSPNNALFTLYREGCRTPIFKRLEYIDPNGYENSFTYEDSEKLLPGCYFLLIGNMENKLETESPLELMGTQLCYRFRILTEGVYLPKPEIKRVSVSRPVVEQGSICGTSGKLDIKIALKGWIEETSDFCIFCYNSDHRLIACVETGEKLTTQDQNTWLKLSLNSSDIWVEGNYSLVFVYNEEPIYLFTFYLSSRAFVQCEIKELQPDTFHYLMVKYGEKKVAWKSILCKVPGMRKMWEQFIPLIEETVFYELSCRQGMSIAKRNRHFVITGVESSVKIKAATYLSSIFLLGNDHVDKVDAMSLISSKNAMTPYEEVDTLMNNRSYHMICLNNFSVLLSPNGLPVLRKITEALQNQEHSWSLVLCGTESEVAQLFEMVPEWNAFFPKEYRLETGNYSLADILYLLVYLLEQQKYKLSPDAELCLYDAIKQSWDKGELMYWGEKEITGFVENAMLPFIRKRIMKRVLLTASPDAQALWTLRADDLELSFRNNQTNSFEENIKPLQAMIGLTEVKERLAEHFNLSCLQKMRQQAGLPVEDGGPYHMIFTGNPGTGKTTVAKLIGKIYHSLGILSKGDVVVTDRSHIVGQYVGDTENNMLDILEKSRGNVLFIDEAYTLYCGKDDRRDFGLRAIEVLLPILAQKNPDMLVIMAGYEKEMELMMNGNQGLAGRFPHKLYFSDYTADELFRIGQNLLEKGEYLLTKEAEELFRKLIAEAVANKNALFSNARWVEQVISSGILPVMAKRLMRTCQTLSKDMLRTIESGDVEEGMYRFINVLEEKPKRNPIGFRA